MLASAVGALLRVVASKSSESCTRRVATGCGSGPRDIASAVTSTGAIFFATVCLGLDLSVAPLLASMTFVINCQNAFYHYKARRKLWDCLGISGEMHIVCRETDCRRDRASPLRLVHRWDHAGLPWRQRQCSGPDDHRRTCAVLHVSRQAMLMTSRMSVSCIRTLKLRSACVSCRVHANGVAAEDRSPVQQPGGRFHHCVSHHTPAR